MGRLVIAHHKSYHPYKAENIERVRRDEEEARLKEAKEEGRLKLADSEARIELLRKRAGISESRSSRRNKDEDIPEPVKLSLKENETQKKATNESSSSYSLMSNGHINLFADLEHDEATRSKLSNRPKERKKVDAEEDDAETDKGYRLAPSKADRTPWYTKAKEESVPQLDALKRDRDEMRKVRQDPLKDVEASLSRLSSKMPPPAARKSTSNPPSIPSTSNTLLDSRLSREQTERQRAAELIARRRREQMGAETPSTVAPQSVYDDLFNRAEVEEATKKRKQAVSWKERVKHWDGTESTGRRW